MKILRNGCKIIRYFITWSRFEPRASQMQTKGLTSTSALFLTEQPGMMLEAFIAGSLFRLHHWSAQRYVCAYLFLIIIPALNSFDLLLHHEIGGSVFLQNCLQTFTRLIIITSAFLPTDPEPRDRFSALPDFLISSGYETGSTQPPEYNWGATWKKSSGSGLEIRDYGLRDLLRWQRGSFYPQQLTLTSSTSGGRSVGIVG
jgi:hypothetical protein